MGYSREPLRTTCVGWVYPAYPEGTTHASDQRRRGPGTEWAKLQFWPQIPWRASIPWPSFGPTESLPHGRSASVYPNGCSGISTDSAVRFRTQRPTTDFLATRRHVSGCGVVIEPTSPSCLHLTDAIFWSNGSLEKHNVSDAFLELLRFSQSDDKPNRKTCTDSDEGSVSEYSAETNWGVSNKKRDAFSKRRGMRTC